MDVSAGVATGTPRVRWMWGVAKPLIQEVHTHRMTQAAVVSLSIKQLTIKREALLWPANRELTMSKASGS